MLLPISESRIEQKDGKMRTVTKRIIKVMKAKHLALTLSSSTKAFKLNPAATLPSPPVLMWFPSVKVIAINLRSKIEFLTSSHALIMSFTDRKIPSKRLWNSMTKTIPVILDFGFFAPLIIATMYFSAAQRSSKGSFFK